eukprot:jgi/Bigna1/35876/e_gw1.11.102.1
MLAVTKLFGLLLLVHSDGKLPSIPRACLPPHDKYKFCDTSLSIEDRVGDLISKLTLEEKPYLLTARESPKGNISRLGIPEYDWGGNCIHGVQSNCAKDGRCPTSFPNPNALGATFNRTVWRTMGSVIGRELRSLWLQGVGEAHESNLPHIGLDCWSPNIGVVRDPRWGRNLETPSEDPLVCGYFGSEYSLGLQNGEDDRFLQAVTTLKHFTANSLEGPWNQDGSYGGNMTRHTVDPSISMYDLHSTYLPAFKRAVEEGEAKGVMCSYNAINGVPSCANNLLLQDILRDTWGFDGYVTSDSGAVADILETHGYEGDWNHTVAAAIVAGCDVESASWPKDHPWATGSPYIDYIPDTVRTGMLSERALDAAVANSLSIRMRLGLFDPIEDQPYWHVGPEEVRSDANVKAAIDATVQGLVLLSNEAKEENEEERGGQKATTEAEAAATLPIPPGSSIAVVGPHANARAVLLGNYLGQVCSDYYNSKSCVETAFEAISARNSKGGGKTFNATGCDVNSTSTEGFEAALEAAGKAEYVVFIGGLDLDIEREGRDRPEIFLPGQQPNLLGKLLSLPHRPKVVLVLIHGGVVTLESSLLDRIPAVISAGYPGFYGASAIAKALIDVSETDLAVNRWGRTPVTWYSHEGWASAAFDMLSFDMAASPGRTHRYYTGTPAYDFGHGLSYATFKLAGKAGEEEKVNGGKSVVKILVDAANEDSRREGDVVLLAFVKGKNGTIPASEPAANVRQTLFGFQRIGPLSPGAAQTATFTLDLENLAQFDKNGKPTVFDGAYQIVVRDGNEGQVVIDNVHCSLEKGCSLTQ